MGGKPNRAFTDTNDGIYHLVATVMAMNHFNERNSDAVPELANFSDCPVQFDIEKSFVFNTDGSFSHDGSQSFFQSDEIPCAMVGTFSDFPALELSVMAQAAQIPFITARSYSLRVVSDLYSPYTSSVFPDTAVSANKVVKFLEHYNRTNFIALLYPMSGVGYQRRESIGFELDERNMRWMSSAYAHAEVTGNTSTSRSYLTAMQNIKDSGFRTIVIALDDPLVDLQPIADAAEQLRMNQGDYFYVFYDNMEPSFLYQVENEILQKLLFGAAWIVGITKELVEDNYFWMNWFEQGQNTADLVNSLNPLIPSEEGYMRVTSDLFNESNPAGGPAYGSAFFYDAVMAAGIGACHALAGMNGTTNGTLTGESHHQGVRQSEFQGATGLVGFGRREFFLGGARKLGTIGWGAINFLSEEMDWFQFSDLLIPYMYGSEWIGEFFIFADGTSTPPVLLRDIPEQNYLSSTLRILGFTLMGISCFSAVCACVWVFMCRNHKVLKASQPFFLYVLCFGTLVQSSTIASISFDESSGWSEDQLSSACMSVPWLLSLGHVVVYSALFTKLWRVNKVLSFSRRKVDIRHVVAPMVGLFMASFLCLALWTALDPLQWERKEIDKETGESIGRCQSNNIGIFIGPLLGIMLIPTILTGFMAYKTKDVDEAYTEGWWDFVLMLVQLEVIFVSAPVITILREESTDGKYLGFAFLLWSFPMSTLILIFLPKVLAYWRAKHGIDPNQQSKRGKHEGTRISGVSSDGYKSSYYSGADQSSSIIPTRTHDEKSKEISVNESIKDTSDQTSQPPLGSVAEGDENGASFEAGDPEADHNSIAEEGLHDVGKSGEN